MKYYGISIPEENNCKRQKSRKKLKKKNEQVKCNRKQKRTKAKM